MDQYREETLRPKSVTIAIWLLYANLVISAFKSYLVLPMVPKIPNVLIYTLPFFVLFLFLIYKIKTGRNWARITFLVISYVHILYIIYLSFQIFIINAPFYLYASFGIVQPVLIIIAFILLFQKPSSQWFMQMDPNPRDNRLSHKMIIFSPICIILSWLTIPIFFDFGFGFFVFFWFMRLWIIFLKQRYYKTATLFFCSSAYILLSLIFFIAGVRSYYNETATLSLPSGIHKPAIFHRMLDPDLRCYRTWEGPTVCGTGLSLSGLDLFDIPQELAVKTMFKLFGPMKGSYTGYYPNYEGTAHLLKTKTTQSFNYSSQENFDQIPSDLQKVYFSSSDLQYSIRMIHAFTLRESKNSQKTELEDHKEMEYVEVKYVFLNPRALLIGNQAVRILYDREIGKIIVGHYSGAPEKANSGSVNIETKPSGAKIFVDGTELGTAPDIIRYIRAGKHKFEIKNEGFKEFVKIINVVDGEEIMLKAILHPIEFTS